MRCCGRRCCGRGDLTDRWFEIGRKTLVRELCVQRLICTMRAIENYIDQHVPPDVSSQIRADIIKIPLDIIADEENSNDENSNDDKVS